MLARATAALAGRELPSDKLSPRRFRRADGVPDDRRAPRGARTSTLDLRRARAHDGIAARGSPFSAARSPHRVRDGRDEPLRQSGPVLRGRRRSLSEYEARDLELAAESGVDLVLAPSPRRCTPTDSRPGSRSRSSAASSRASSDRALPRRRNVVLKLLSIARPRRIYFGQKGCPAGGGDPTDDPRSRAGRRSPCPPDGPRRGRARTRHATLLSAEERKRARALPGARDARPRRGAPRARGVERTRDRLHRIADFDPPVLAGAVRVGSTRLIDNVPLEGDP